MEDNETILRSIFNRYDTKKTGKMSLQQFALLITQLGKYVSQLKDAKFIEAPFALFDKDSDNFLNYNEFSNWWASKDHYSFFSGKKAILLRKAYVLYTRYAKNRTMTLSKFQEMMESLEIAYSEVDFDALDKNEDGLINFDEFCKWLKWF